MKTLSLESALPIVAAPMAGGATTTSSARAAIEAGAFAFLAAGYKSVEAMGAEIAQARRWGHPFGVNVFVPGPEEVDRVAFAGYAAALAVEAEPYGLTLDPVPRTDDDSFPAKLAVLHDDPVPVVSFTFGLPTGREVARLRRAGTVVLATVTTPDEARAAEDADVDGLVVQGPGAGGHSATWDPDRRIGDAATVDVVRAVCGVSALPVIAAGGVDGPAAVRALIAAGAHAVAIGTLLLRTDESGATAVHRAALASPPRPETVVTRAFTGRPARAIRNGFVDRQDPRAITAYPAVHHLTRKLRSRAAAAGDVDRVHLWAGTGFRSARSGPVGDEVVYLASQL